MLSSPNSRTLFLAFSTPSQEGDHHVDTDRETSARLALDEKIIYVDSEGREWSAVTVVRFIFENIAKGVSIIKTAKTLTKMGIPTPRCGRWWHTGTIFRILSNPLYMGKAVVNRWRKSRDEKTMKFRTTLKSKEENITLDDGIVPPIISEELFMAVQEQLEINKQDSIRNTSEEHQGNLGILRAGYCHCGVCGRTMTIVYPKASQKPYYRCQKRTGREEYVHNHDIFILANRADSLAWEKVKETVSHPELVRKRAEEVRRENKLIIGRDEIEANIVSLQKQMDNLIKFAQSASDDDTITRLSVTLKDLERQKHEAEGLLMDIEEDEEENEKVEAEIRKFEEWAEKVSPILTDPEYQPTYEEGRLAVRILGIHLVITPTNPDDGNTTDRKFDITITADPPKIMETLKGGSPILFPTNSDYDSRCAHQ